MPSDFQTNATSSSNKRVLINSLQELLLLLFRLQLRFRCFIMLPGQLRVSFFSCFYGLCSYCRFIQPIMYAGCGFGFPKPSALANNLNRLLLLIHGLILSYSPVSYSLLLLFPKATSCYSYSLHILTLRLLIAMPISVTVSYVCCLRLYRWLAGWLAFPIEVPL